MPMTDEQISEALRLASDVAEKASLLPAEMDAETDICCCPKCEMGPPYPDHGSYVYGLSCGKVLLQDETLDDMPMLDALVKFIIHARTAAPTLDDAVQSLASALASAQAEHSRLQDLLTRALDCLENLALYGEDSNAMQVLRDGGREVDGWDDDSDT